MKILLITLLPLFYVIQSFAEIENGKSTGSTPTTTIRPPYYTNSTANYYYVNEALRAPMTTIFNLISRYTCLKFQYTGEKPISNSIGINFYESSNGENIVVLSNSPDQPTNVSLEKNVFSNYRNLTFYIGLALGIIPEIRRHDRGEDLDVYMENINDSYTKYYNIETKENTLYLNDTEFDFGSPMFFDPFFGSKDGNYTYTVKLYKNYQPSFGNGRVFSHNDYKHMFYYYCDTSKITVKCNNGGYYLNVPHSSKEPKCKCPKYLTGETCSSLENDKDGKCGSQRNYSATSIKRYFEVTNNTGKCHYNITSEDKDKNVNVTIEKLEFSNNDCTIGGVYLEVLVRNDKGAKGIYLCRNSSNIVLPSLSSEVFVAFYGNKDSNYLNISYEAIEKEKKN